MSPPKVTLSTKRSIHNYDEIYAQTKTLFECKYSILLCQRTSGAIGKNRYFDGFVFFWSEILSISAKKLPKNVNKTAVFACNELDLEEIQVYGFDYDYTLANYKKSLHYLLYGLARDSLVEKYKVSWRIDNQFNSK